MKLLSNLPKPSLDASPSADFVEGYKYGKRCQAKRVETLTECLKEVRRHINPATGQEQIERIDLALSSTRYQEFCHE